MLCVYVHVMLLCDNNQKCCIQTCCPAFGSHFVLCTTHMQCGYHGYLSRTLSFFNVSQLLILCYLIDTATLWDNQLQVLFLNGSL